MAKLKKWQCPHCPQDSARFWNMVVHIRRAHRGLAEPVEKGDLAEKSLSMDPNKPNIYRKYSPNQRKSNRLSCGYEKVSKDKDNENNGDIIDYVYSNLKEIEEKEYKISEIKRIISQHRSSVDYYNPRSIDYYNPPPNTNTNIDTGGTRPEDILNNTDYFPTVQTYGTTSSSAGSSEAIEKTTDSSSPSNYKYEKQHFSSHKHLDEIPPNPEDASPKWVIKRNIRGEVIDLYMIDDD